MKGPLKLSKDTWATFVSADRVADSVPGWKGNSKVSKQKKDNLNPGKKSQHQRNQIEQ